MLQVWQLQHFKERYKCSCRSDVIIIKAFNTGDWVETGIASGTIKEVGLFTIIDTFDNVYVSIPNSSIWNSTIINHSHHETRRIDVDIGIHYDTDLDLVYRPY